MEQLAEQFLNTYYNTMITDRPSLINFYTDNSTLTYEGQTYRGLKEISEKFEGFSFKKIQFALDNFDHQDSCIQGGLMILLSGSLLLDDQNKLQFSQFFHLLPNGNTYYVHNELFRVTSFD